MTLAPLPPGTRLAPDPTHQGGFRFEVVSVLGAGGFGITYRARDLQLDSTVVIKELALSDICVRKWPEHFIEARPTFEGEFQYWLERFVDEARRANRIRNRHVVRVIAVWKERGTAFYAMDEVRGARSLPGSTHTGWTRPAWSVAAARALQLLQALGAVHAQGMLHGDVKPSNVLLDEQGDVVLIDFGTARNLSDLQHTATSTMFTPGYAPPELMVRERIREAGASSDLYSWAMVVVGTVLRHPTPDGHPMNALTRLQLQMFGGKDPYPLLSEALAEAGASEAWRTVLLSCLALNPSERLPSAATIIDVLGDEAPPDEVLPASMRVPGPAGATVPLPALHELNSDAALAAVQQARDAARALAEQRRSQLVPAVGAVPPVAAPGSGSYAAPPPGALDSRGEVQPRAPRHPTPTPAAVPTPAPVSSVPSGDSGSRANGDPATAFLTARRAAAAAEEAARDSQRHDEGPHPAIVPAAPTVRSGPSTGAAPGPVSATDETAWAPSATARPSLHKSDSATALPPVDPASQATPPTVARVARSERRLQRWLGIAAAVAVGAGSVSAIGLWQYNALFNTPPVDVDPQGNPVQGSGTPGVPPAPLVWTPAPMGFARIEPGSFTIGSPADEPGHKSNEVQRPVTITRPFALQMREVTQIEWRGTMQSTPSFFTRCGKACPVERVNFYEALAYANARSTVEGLPECYTLSQCTGELGSGRILDHPEGQGGTGDYVCAEVRFAGPDCLGYRLPTDEEWEYAARAETTTPTWVAVDPAVFTATTCPGEGLLRDSLWWNCNAIAGYFSPIRPTEAGGLRLGPQPTGNRVPNPWGLRDMHGNIAEWTWTASAPDSDTPGLPVVRGGSFRSSLLDVRAAARVETGASTRSLDVGFRLARTLP